MLLCRSIAHCVALALTASPLCARAWPQERRDTSAQDRSLSIRLDPAATEIRFTLRGFPHTIHGTFPLKGGMLAVNPASGLAQGEILVDASAGKTGNAGLDKRMEDEVLQSNRYPAIFFHAEHVRGMIPPKMGMANIILDGTFNIHGADHPMELRLSLDRHGTALSASTHFAIPYGAWGMKNPSTTFTRYSGQVLVNVTAKGMVETEKLPTRNRPE